MTFDWVFAAIGLLALAATFVVALAGLIYVVTRHFHGGREEDGGCDSLDE